MQNGDPKKLVFILMLAVVSSLSVVASDDPGPQPDAQPLMEEFTTNLNLGFEASGVPKGWMAGGNGYSAVIDEAVVHSGNRSLRISRQEEGQFASATTTFPVDIARGKRLHLTAWVKSEGITEGWAGLWMRVDGADGVLAFDNMQDRPITGATDWAQYEIELDVADEASAVFFGALHTGNGIIWVDSFSFVITEQPEPPPLITVTGMIEDRRGAGVPGAMVAFMGPGADRASARVTSDSESRFSVEVPAGTYAVTATARGFAAAYQPPAPFGADGAGGELVLTLGDGGFTIGGTVTDERVEPVTGALIVATRLSNDDGDIFYTETDDRGRYELNPIPGDGYLIHVDSEGHRPAVVAAESGADQVIDITVFGIGPAPDEVIAWIKGHAIPLVTVEAENGFADLQPVKALVGDARVVALGEATHGSREFFQLKHRLLEFLVVEMGFTVFAIEANWPECLAINDYVLDGKGTAEEALDGIYFWTWNTEEVLAQIEWMRRYNEDPTHEDKVKFLGFDMQTPNVAAERVVAYLEEVAPDLAEEVRVGFAAFTEGKLGQNLAQLPDEDRRALTEEVESLLQAFDAHSLVWVGETSESEWTLIRWMVVMLQQVGELYFGGDSSVRDAAMAANLEWILETEPPGTKVVAWAHNAHISTHPARGTEWMGSHLRRSLGEGYLALGFAFNQGSFQAIDMTGIRAEERALASHDVGPAPEGNLDAAFARVGLPLFALDLRQLPTEGIVAVWFANPHPMRQIGAVFSSESQMSTPIVPADHFDGMIFVDTTTRARPVGHPGK